MDTCIPTAMPATTRCRILPLRLLGPSAPEVRGGHACCIRQPQRSAHTGTGWPDYCDQLFAAEKKLAELSAEERQKQRLAVEKPMLRAFWCWLEELEQQPLAGI